MPARGPGTAVVERLGREVLGMVIRHGHGPSPQADRDAGVTVKNHVIEAIRLNKYEAADVLRKTVQEEVFCPTMKNPEFQTRKNLSVNRRTSRPPVTSLVS